MTKRTKNQILLAIVLIVVIVARLLYVRINKTEVTTTLKGGEVIVKSIIDGDTIHVISNGKEEKVRLIGIDAPEINHGEGGEECFGPEATAALEKKIENKKAIIETDQEDRDQYGRLLRYVWVDGEMINEWLVKEGYAYAKTYKPNIYHQSILYTAMNNARSGKKGLWWKCSS